MELRIKEREPSISLKHKLILLPTLEHLRDSSVSICVHLETFRGSTVRWWRVHLWTWAFTAVLLPATCVTLGTSFDFSVIRFPHLWYTIQRAVLRINTVHTWGAVKLVHGTHRANKNGNYDYLFRCICLAVRRWGQPWVGPTSGKEKGFLWSKLAARNKKGSQRGWVGHPETQEENSLQRAELCAQPTTGLSWLGSFYGSWELSAGWIFALFTQL